MPEADPAPTEVMGSEPKGPLTGRPLLRSEDPAPVRGDVAFTADIRHRWLDGAAHIAFVRSPLAAGTIERIDVTDARSMPGVIATLTGRDIDHLAPYALPIGDRFAQPLLPRRTIGFAGQALALVVAGSEARAADAVEAVGDFYDTEGRNTFPSGTHLAVVEVDIETGRVVLRRLVAVDDAGTVVNPLVVAGQLHGGIASAVGQVLGEVIVHDRVGNQVTGSLLDYPLPTADQLPSFELVPSATASGLNSLGFKGVGESGTVGATGAVHNAVVDAMTHLGVEHLDLPCTPERVWRAIHRR